MTTSFRDGFRSLTGFSPMRWQCRMFSRFVENDLPDACDIPTGLGKTSIMVIWLLALAQQAAGGRVGLPRRLVYVVNRRTVVDQATGTAERMRRRLLEPEAPDWQEDADTLKGIASALHRLCAAEDVPLGISTLRGELADNEEWRADPARPAIVVGTIDMIGSKLLFSGYGDGRYGRAHHAGLVGYDALIVHDEAHLTPAFNDLIRAVAQEQGREAAQNTQVAAIVRPIRVVELSATRRDTEGDPFTLEPEDEDEAIVGKRMRAAKRLYLHPVPTDSIAEKIVELSTTHEDSRHKILIYVRSPELAQKVDSALARALGHDRDERVALLTGTIRGHERDTLVEKDPVYRALLHPEHPVEKSVYLVSTSAGEVGIDLDADHLVCDHTTLDALIQRLGRVNRRGGEGRTARVDVVGETERKEKPSSLDGAIAATNTLLRRWVADAGSDHVNVSPQNLRLLLARQIPEAVQAAFSPKAQAPPLGDILLDTWSLTTIDKMPGRPEVAPLLHGLTSDPPETHVAWRREVSVLHDAGVDEASLRDWFRACRVEAQERLRDRTDRVKKVLAGLLSNMREENNSLDSPVVLLDEHGGPSWSRLSALTASDSNLAYRTVVLPVEVGGLDRNGMLDSKPDRPPGLPLDVAEHESTDRRRERWLHRRSPNDGHFERLVSGEIVDALPEELREKERIPLHKQDEGNDSQTVDLVLLVSPVQSALDDPENVSARQTLAAHTESIVEHMSRIVERLGIEEPLRTALIEAARRHDKGKDRVVWQRYARNSAGTELLAKARSYLHPRVLGGYRHEFGSLLDAMGDARLRQFPERELVLHLVSSHHGWARPHFEPRSLDGSLTTSDNNRAFAEVVRRFGQLQQRFGRWGLAWLESLVRCADIASSKEAVRSTGTRP
ncbi:MAG: type I-U CRISPR-associated helicase/endonuclease Cas3 [Acidobacteriota bacterium]